MSSSSSDGESSSKCSLKDDESDVELTFTGYNMDKRDYHCIKQFLSQIFCRGIRGLKGGDVGSPDLSQLARYLVDIIGEYVGTTAKNLEEDEPLAFISLMPLALPKELEAEDRDGLEKSLKEFVKILLESAHKGRIDKNLTRKIEEVLKDRADTAILFHERFINLPVEVGAPLYQQLLDDLPAAADESRAFSPKHILLMTPIYRELDSQLDRDDADDDDDDRESRRKKKRKHQQREETNEYQFYYAEDELLTNISQIFWDFKVKSPHDSADSRRAFGSKGVEPARRVFLLDMDQFRDFVAQTQALVS